MKCFLRSVICFAWFGAVGGLSACQLPDMGQSGEPAVLTLADEGVLVEVKSVLADALGRAAVTLGPGDLTKVSIITVLPPRLGPLEGRSTTTPILFDVMIAGSHCFVVRRDTGDEYALPNIGCRAVRDTED